MGAGRLMAAVADAGPLLHLFEINQFSLFCLFDSIAITAAVWSETIGKRRLPPDILYYPPFTIYPPLDEVKLQEFLVKNNLLSLHPGEQESLFLCHTQSISLFLTDDLAAREAAKKRNVTPVGSVGVLVRAYREKRLSKEETIQNLRNLQSQSTLFVASAIIELAIEMMLM